jgi:hypothetical protein
MLGNDFLVPLDFERGELSFFLDAAAVFVDFSLFMLVKCCHLLSSFRVRLHKLLNQCFMILTSLLNRRISFLLNIDFSVDSNRKRVFLVVLQEHVVSKLVMESRAFSVEHFYHLHSIFLIDANLWVDNLALGQNIQHVRDEQSYVLGKRGFCILLFGEVLEHRAKLLFVVVKH